MIFAKTMDSYRVLLVEDNFINRKLALAIMTRVGLTNVDIAQNGHEAVAASRRAKYDLILMDLQMPEMNGLVASRMIRANVPLNAKTPIVALTANASATDKENCLEAGMNEFLAKPISPLALTACIGRWLTA